MAAEVERSHATMGVLQNETLAHIFAMRALLKPDQAAKFDAAVTKALTEANRAKFVITSTPGEGTLVEITFPAMRVLAG